MKKFIYHHINHIYFIFAAIALVCMATWWLRWFFPGFNPAIETYDSTMFLVGIASVLTMICWFIAKNEAMKEKPDGKLYIFEEDDGSSNLVNIEFDEDVVGKTFENKKELTLEIVTLRNNYYGKRR